METVTFSGRFLIEGFCFTGFVNFLSCNDPQFLEEVVKLAKAIQNCG